MSRTDAHAPARVQRAQGTPERRIAWSRYKGHGEFIKRVRDRRVPAKSAHINEWNGGTE